MSKKDWQLLKAYQTTGLTPEEVERVKRERDAAIRDMEHVGDCETCRHENPPNPCELMNCFLCKDETCHCQTCDEGSNWKWRGVKEDV